MAYRKELDIPNKQDCVLRLINKYFLMAKEKGICDCLFGKQGDPHKPL